MTELWTPDQPTTSHEAMLVQQAIGLDPLELDGGALEEYNGYVAIVGQFTRTNPSTGNRETISPSRVEAIPAISARFCGLVQAARDELTTDDVVKEWARNMPENDGSRHPDLLFDIAQFNFGHDGPVGDIVAGLTQAEIRRKELIDSYRSYFRHSVAQLRYEHRDVDLPEEMIDKLVDSI